MRRGLFLALPALFLGSACDQEPCEVAGGPTVRLDVALATCNATPRAVVTAPSSVPKRSDVQVNGTESSDANGDELLYSWTLSERPPTSTAELDNDKLPSPSFFADVTGRYVVTLTVSDGVLTSAPESKTIFSSNTAPVANAGGDQVSPNLGTVTVDGSASSDPDGDAVVGYAWRIVEKPASSRAVLTDETFARASITLDVRGMYLLGLKVSDGELESEEDTIAIIGGSTNPPVADARAAATATVGVSVTLDGRRSSDADGERLTYRWSVVSSPDMAVVPLLAETSSRASFVPERPGEYRFSLIVSDGFFFSDPDEVTVQAVYDPFGTDTFDPNRVYIQGSNNMGKMFLCDLYEPGRVTVGFENWIDRLAVRRDGKLLYLDTVDFVYEAFEFVVDPYFPEAGGGFRYPANPRDNDLPGEIARLDNCRYPDHLMSNGFTNEIMSVCGDDITAFYFYSDGTPVQDCVEAAPGRTRQWPRGFGWDGAIACTESVRDPMGIVHPFVGAPAGGLYHFKARRDGGFWGFARNGRGSFDRYLVDNDGTVALDVSFGPPPAGVTHLGFGQDGFVVDGAGRLYFPEYQDGNLLVIVRYDSDAPGTIVFANGGPGCSLMGRTFLVTMP